MVQHAAMIEGDDESRTIEACRRGDRDAFRRLFELYGDRVHSIALHYSGDATAARDVTQQVFLKLFRTISQYRGDAEFSTWLYRVVVNACEDERRRGSRFVPLDDDATPASTQGSQEEKYFRLEIAETVGSAVAGLSPKLRLPILLRYVEGLSYDEIATALGCSIGTVSSRLNRGHRMLAEKLEHLRGSVTGR